MSKSSGEDLNVKVKRKVCQWCDIPKQITVPPLLLCPVCDQKALIVAETNQRG